MDAIKSFVYLDEYKMYSLSSQIFKGLIESLTSYSSDTKERGEVNNDVVENLVAERTTQERKYLHDYSYIRFESALPVIREANFDSIVRKPSTRYRFRQREFRRSSGQGRVRRL